MDLGEAGWGGGAFLMKGRDNYFKTNILMRRSEFRQMEGQSVSSQQMR